MDGSYYVDVSVNRIGGKLAANLVNTCGPHSDDSIHVFDEVPSIGPLRVKIRSPAKPQSVTLQPGGRRVAYRYNDGAIGFTLPYLKIHDIIIVE